MDTTIIYIHRGIQSYIDGVFSLTRHYNKKNKIVLIGDEDNKAVAEKYGFVHYLYADYDEPIEYHHVSVNTETYEKFCFSRWFILKNFMNKNNIDHVVYSDSDNAIIYNINSIKYDNACLAVETVVVPNIFFCNKQTINTICSFYNALYSESYVDFFLRLMESKYLTYYENNTNKPHFSDMMFLRMALDENEINFLRLNEDTKKGNVYNANINNIKTKINKGKVFIENTNSVLYNIHFAGAAKNKVSEFLLLLQY